MTSETKKKHKTKTKPRRNQKETTKNMGGQPSIQIEFQHVNPEAKAGDYMSSEKPGPFFKLAQPEKYLSYMLEKNVIVIHQGSIRAQFDYPMRHSCVRVLKPPTTESGEPTHFTRGDLAMAIAKEYARIYDEEDQSTSVPAGPHEKFVMNRNETNGTHGIYKHHLGDLMLHKVQYKAEDDVYILGIE